MKCSLVCKKGILISAFIYFAFLPLSSAAIDVPAAVPSSEQLTEEQTLYFMSLYKDTWKYFEDYVEKLTGMPYDSSAKQPPTSLANLGYYLASTAIAYKTGLIEKTEALQKVEKALDSLEKVPKWRGFPRPWFLVRNLKPTHGDEFTYTPHIPVLIGGLIVAKSTFPELIDRIEYIILDMQFKDLYDRHNGWLKGGYSEKIQNFTVIQPWGKWYYKYYASNIRLLSFYGIARQAFPMKHWTSLIRPVQEVEGERFFVTGYEEPGIAEQYVAGLFLDERKTDMGASQRSYALAQMKYAKRIKSPVWGWSACESPMGRYLTYGEMRDDIVAPHGSLVAAIYFPQEVYQNLKELEKLGARPKPDPESGAPAYGFLDSLNWQTGDISRNYLTVSHGMSFLTLANLLFDGVVWKSFQADPVVERGLEMFRKVPQQAPESMEVSVHY